jgi:pimeloyl-ACP methyl ester carboxylesterase
VSKRAFTVGEWTGPDGLVLRYRDYPGPRDKPPLLCLPGLTRNARDFEPIAEAFGGDWRVLCLDFRGRGLSDYARDAATYTPVHYVADVLALLDQEALERVVAIGTSLGGIVTMLLALQAPKRIAAAVLNDIGPDIEPEGLSRIRGYVGQGRSFPTWMHAARGLQEQGGVTHPDFALADWLRMAKRMMAVGAGGRIAFDYDMKIAEPFNQPPPGEPFDMWPALRALAGRPVLALRGELSDMLSAATLARMQDEVPGLEAITIPRIGHTPTFEEPQARTAVAALLDRVT